MYEKQLTFKHNRGRHDRVLSQGWYKSYVVMTEIMARIASVQHTEPDCKIRTALTETSNDYGVAKILVAITRDIERTDGGIERLAAKFDLSEFTLEDLSRQIAEDHPLTIPEHY